MTGTVTFLKKLASMSDVWIVSITQALEWIKNPTTLEKIEDFAPWKCDSTPPPACPKGKCFYCLYPEGQWMGACVRRCPPHYPWVGNPDGN